jgi:hypothetical protein
MVRHDTESGNEQSDADELPKSQLPGDMEINLTEHKNSCLEVVQARGISAEHIARTANGSDKRALSGTVDFPAQAANVHVDEIRSWNKCVTPDRLEDHFASQNLVGMSHHEFKYAKLRRL